MHSFFCLNVSDCLKSSTHRTGGCNFTHVCVCTFVTAVPIQCHGMPVSLMHACIIIVIHEYTLHFHSPVVVKTACSSTTHQQQQYKVSRKIHGYTEASLVDAHGRKSVVYTTVITTVSDVTLTCTDTRDGPYKKCIQFKLCTQYITSTRRVHSKL